MMPSDEEYKLAPWRIIRPFSKYLGKMNHEPQVGDVVTTFLVHSEWADQVNPGDPAQLIDKDSDKVIIDGEVVFTKKVKIRNVLPADVQRSIFRYFKGTDIATPEDIQKGLASMYGDSISLDTVVAIIGVVVTTLYSM